MKETFRQTNNLGLSNRLANVFKSLTAKRLQDLCKRKIITSGQFRHFSGILLKRKMSSCKVKFTPT